VIHVRSEAEEYFFHGVLADYGLVEVDDHGVFCLKEKLLLGKNPKIKSETVTFLIWSLFDNPKIIQNYLILRGRKKNTCPVT
jgi:hypothetical protein